MAQNISLLGATYSDVPAVELPKSGGGTASFTDVTDTTAAASDVASGKYFYTAQGVRTSGTGSGGATLITKSITQNGTYNASSDNADGYSIVTVNVSGGGGGDDKINELIDRTISGSYYNSNITTVGQFAFGYCSQLNSVNLPAVTNVSFQAFYYCSLLRSVVLQSAVNIGASAFASCFQLLDVSLPNVVDFGSSVFANCSKLETISLPKAASVGSYMFQTCSNLSEAYFPVASVIYNYAFRYCRKLLKLELLSNSVCSLSGASAFANTPIAGSTASTGGVYGSIYVPSSLYSAYISATNWAAFSSRFVSV